MLEFLKRCGLGILYVIAAPFAVILLALFAVLGLVVFLFMLVKSLILFFSGRSVFDDLPEDIEAKRRLGTLVDTREKKAKPVDKAISDETHEETHEIERAAPQKVPEDASDDAGSDHRSSVNPGGEA
jgi:hypothetical protein